MNALDSYNACMRGEGGRVVKPRKLLRVAGFNYLLALDGQLQKTTGRGLSAFQCPESFVDAPVHSIELGPEKRVPTLSIAMDQGGGMFNSMFFCVYMLRLNCVVMADCSHRTWDDVKLAVAACGWTSWMLLAQECPFSQKEITLVIPLASRGARPERVVAGRVRKIGKRAEGA